MGEYQNPINEVPMVTVPKWEYAQLVGKAATLEILQKLVELDRKYAAADLMEMLFKDREVEE